MSEISIAGFQDCKTGEFLKLEPTSPHGIKKMELVSEHPLDNDAVFMVEGIRLKDVNKECNRIVLNKGQTAVKVPGEYKSLINILSENTPSSRIRVMYHIGESKLAQFSSISDYEPENNFNFGGLGGSVASVMESDIDRPVSFGYDAITIKFLKIGDQSFGSTEGISEVTHAQLPADGIFELYKLQCNSQKTLSYFEGFIGDVKIIAGVYRKEAVTFEGNLSVRLYQVVSGDVIDSLSFEVISSPIS